MLPLWLGMSCLLLLNARTGGRVYNGRKKSPAMTTQRLRSGPHVCYSGMGGGCCPGWTISPGTGQCLQPLCSFGCGSGFCIAPNVCSCRDGHQGFTCSDDFANERERALENKGPPLTCLYAACDQNCRLVNGAPMCSCFHGYSLGKDGKSCYDIDECSRPQSKSICQQQCKNSIGSYRCLCYYGYQISPNGHSCIPTKHLNTITGLAAPVPCGEYGCELMCNEGGCEHVSRVCPVGFRMTETANGVICTDIDECEAAACSGTCINTEGGFICDCGPGMKLSADRTVCYDIDECSAKRSPCQQRCKNLQGSYKCLCATGYLLQNNGHTCADINECRRAGMSQRCKHFCHNTHGSFFCSCRAGFILGPDKASCMDLDECLQNVTLCPQGICLNTLGSYYCSCPLGLILTDGACTDIRVGVQTTNLPWETQAVHKDWKPYLPTLPPLQITETKNVGVSPTLRISTMLSKEFPSTTTSAPQSTFTDTLLHPQHLKVGHSPLVQKASGISQMPSKENTIGPSGTTTLAESSEHISNCWHNENLYFNGRTWTDSTCIDCTCQEGKVSCERRTCRPNCSHPIVHPDNCCPSCDGCFFKGLSRADGEIFFNSPDNCTICICLFGNVTCIPPVCPPITCTDPYFSDCCLKCPDGCEYQGQLYPHGAQFSRDDNGCTSCLCQNGAVECSFLPCTSLECPREDWVLKSGQCCFKCREPLETTGCPFDDNGIEIPIGQIWSPGDPCEICICQTDGSIMCKKTDCVETCPNPIKVPGQCCPDCSAGCSYGKRTYKNNENFPSTTDPCLTCICLLGTIACSPIECALNCTYPFHDEGECCPLCRDCTYDGRKVLNGQMFSLESEPCTQCTCQNGEVHCQDILCSTFCSHPYIFPGECCSPCEECSFEGHVLENEGSYILKSDPCVVCHCSDGNVQCEQKVNSCIPCEQNTQDCYNEVPDTTDIKRLQNIQAELRLSSGFQRSNIPLKSLNKAKLSQHSGLSLFHKIIFRKNTQTLDTTPHAKTSTERATEHTDSILGYTETDLTLNIEHPTSNSDTTVTLPAHKEFTFISTPPKDMILQHTKSPNILQSQETTSSSIAQVDAFSYPSIMGKPVPTSFPVTSSKSDISNIIKKALPPRDLTTSTQLPQNIPDMSTYDPTSPFTSGHSKSFSQPPVPTLSPQAQTSGSYFTSIILDPSVNPKIFSSHTSVPARHDAVLTSPAEITEVWNLQRSNNVKHGPGPRPRKENENVKKNLQQ
ncbi:hypothetical protein GDO86_008767 [Hymenochirus boettgeri]|uniref:von Willebrand factor C and EGF domain-containing protein n=1 Tax=Hymenochirus boettgeri TaxID=247094 RepID=A0A8T2J6B5_9PIPI|nr:hypothetical protein GDO86_008767 [Hymenochirus boettgeri]